MLENALISCSAMCSAFDALQWDILLIFSSVVAQDQNVFITRSTSGNGPNISIATRVNGSVIIGNGTNGARLIFLCVDLWHVGHPRQNSTTSLNNVGQLNRLNKRRPVLLRPKLFQQNQLRVYM